MKSVMISIQPKWCELISSGEKTVEVRKSKPNIATPFKCYIYQTKSKWMFNILRKIGLSDMANKLLLGKGKVIGEFVCNAIISNCEMANADIAEQRGRIKREVLLQYAGGKQLYGWNISELVIYDRAKEINEFYRKKEKKRIYYRMEHRRNCALSQKRSCFRRNKKTATELVLCRGMR